MKIAFVFPRFTGPYGGERHLINLANVLAENKNSVTVFTHARHPACDALFSPKVQVRRISGARAGGHDLQTFFDWFFMFLTPFVAKERYDVLAPMGWQSVFGAALVKTLNSKNRNTPIVYHCNEPPRFLYDLRRETLARAGMAAGLVLRVLMPVVRFFDAWSLKKSDKVVSNSEWTAEQVKKTYHLESEVVYPGVEVERFTRHTKKEARARLGIGMDAMVYVSVSKLHRRKRIDEAIRLFEKQKSRKEEKLFYVIGTGPESDNLKAFAKQHAVEGVSFLGEVEEASVPLYLNAADYFVFTAVNEPFGIAPLEAQVAGCKVIPRAPRYPVTGWARHGQRIAKIYQEALK